MKKILILTLIALAAALILCACGGDAPETAGNGTEAPEVEETSEATGDEVDLSVYKRPAEVYFVDFTLDDPSNEEIEFSYDGQGRIKGCKYLLDGKNVYVNYNYTEEGSVRIYAFIEDVLAAEDVVELSAFDPAKGFDSFSGYYFKGYSAR